MTNVNESDTNRVIATCKCGRKVCDFSQDEANKDDLTRLSKTGYSVLVNPSIVPDWALEPCKDRGDCVMAKAFNTVKTKSNLLQ